MSEVSVIIPAFNAQYYIGEAIESTLRQTLKASEIIVVDDGSSDKTIEIVKSFNHRVWLINQPNQGSGSARNNGIKRSKGKWVAFLDADDEWEKDHLATLLEAAHHYQNAVMVYSGKIWIDQNGSVIPSLTIQNEYPSGWIFNKLIENNYISSASCVIARKDILESCNGFRTETVFRNSQDYELWLRIAANNQVASTALKTVRYRRHENNQTLKKSGYALGHLASVRSGCSLVNLGKVNSENKPDEIDADERLKRAYREAIISTFYFSDYKASRSIFYQSLKDKIFHSAVILRGLICHAPASIVSALRGIRRGLGETGKFSGNS